jgi:hypothetical protein
MGRAGTTALLEPAVIARSSRCTMYTFSTNHKFSHESCSRFQKEQANQWNLCTIVDNEQMEQSWVFTERIVIDWLAFRDVIEQGMEF